MTVFSFQVTTEAMLPMDSCIKVPDFEQIARKPANNKTNIKMRIANTIASENLYK
jgi:hypothetical protein